MSDAGILSAVFVAVMAAFYLMFLRPVQKDQARHKREIRDLRPGDEVLTTSGFIAKVRDIYVPEDGATRIALELAEGVIFTAMPSAILERLHSTPAEAANTEQPGLRS